MNLMNKNFLSLYLKNLKSLAINKSFDRTLFEKNIITRILKRSHEEKKLYNNTELTSNSFIEVGKKKMIR